MQNFGVGRSDLTFVFVQSWECKKIDRKEEMTHFKQSVVNLHFFRFDERKFRCELLSQCEDFELFYSKLLSKI